MAESDESGNGSDVSYLKSDLARAVETHSPAAIENLDKSETVFYLCSVLGVEPPEEHPSEHNGTVPRNLSQQWAKVLGDYTERTGGDAFRAGEALADDREESDDEETDGNGGGDE